MRAGDESASLEFRKRASWRLDMDMNTPADGEGGQKDRRGESAGAGEVGRPAQRRLAKGAVGVSAVHSAATTVVEESSIRAL